MQTFLPYKDFEKSAKCLDRQRLGKQRVEAMQILQILTGHGKKTKNGKIAWENHPAVKMWKGYEVALYRYIQAICKEWIRRGYKDTIYQKSFDLWRIDLYSKGQVMKFPVWLGNREFHKSHKSNLLRKKEDFYSKYNWKVPNNLPYVWPTKGIK